MDIFTKLRYFLKHPVRVVVQKYYKKLLSNTLNQPEKYLDLKFKILKNTESDIYEHLDTLSEYASTVESVFETGVRGGVSSWSLMHGLKNNNKINKFLFLNDINECDISEILKIAEKLKIDLEYKWINNLDLNLTRNFDLLFIDTWHIYGQLKRELVKFSPFINKFILIHDTTTFGELGESLLLGQNIKQQSIQSGYQVKEIKYGLNLAIEEFLSKNLDWTLEKQFKNCNGLTILKKIGN